MSSPSLDNLIAALKCLPGVGQKSAQRMALHLLERDREGAAQIAATIEAALGLVQHCSRCRNFTDLDVCQLCSDDTRDQTTLCVVETPADVIAVESSGVYRGRYFVLLGRLSPLDGFGPDQLGIDALEDWLQQGDIQEIILATSATV